ncbi:BURP domain-containing protein BNM2A-like isoform X2 [Herrania umbratica]|nr:BURP domain-containing protein BNM2A-like isoform X2 [Herrania umbratica]XP_021286966.1 BURP domain-containing protein BNM2A-like isoform X2 [Herrania umbratica]
MGSDFASWCIYLSVLLALMCAQAGNARKITHRQLKEEGGSKNYLQQPSNTMDGHTHLLAHKDHMDPSINIFFKIDDLKLGKTMPVYLPSKDLSASPHLLSREEANSIPFSSTQLPQLLQFFSFSKDSRQAKAMDYTLRQCELEPTKGEIRFCATSLESMLDFARSVFGSDAHLKVLTATVPKEPTVFLQNYTILDMPKQILSSRIIACHTLPYPYAVFYCHSQKSETRLFQVSLGAENGDRAQAPAVCHMDTSQWDHDHVSFRVLKIKPGSSPVCHFLPPDSLVWVPLPARMYCTGLVRLQRYLMKCIH